MSQYETKVIPFVENTRRVNPLLRIPFVGTAFELKELGKQLMPDEEIMALTECKFNDVDQILATVTDRRLIIIQKGLILNRKVLAYELSNVVQASVSRDFLTGQVTVTMKDGFSFQLTKLWWSDTENFHRNLEQARLSV